MKCRKEFKINRIYLLSALSLIFSSNIIAQTCGQSISRSFNCHDDAASFVGLYAGEGVGIGRANLRISDADAVSYKNAVAGKFEVGYNWPLQINDNILGVVANYSVIRPTTAKGSTGDVEIGHINYGLSLLLGFPDGKSLTYAKLGFGRLNSVGNNKYHSQNYLFALGYEYKFNNNWSVDAEFETSVANGRNVSPGTPIPTSRAITLGMRYYFENIGNERKSSSEEIVYQDPPPAKKNLAVPQALKVIQPLVEPPSYQPAAGNTYEPALAQPLPAAQDQIAKPVVSPNIPERTLSPPRNESLTLPSDDFFSWRTKYAIQSEGREALNLLSNKLKGVTFERIVVKSYTDIRDAKDFKKIPKASITRETQQTDNSLMTKIRAESIRDFLAKEATVKIPLEKINAEGKGSQEAKMTKVCTGNKRLSPKQMASCMSEDRRIVIDIIGVRS